MSNPQDVPHFNTQTTDFELLPGFDSSSQAVLYASPDGTRLAGSFKEAGSHTMTMPYDEFFYVISGSASVAVTGGASLVLNPGDCCYLRQGQEVSFEMSDDFHDVAVLISDTPFDINNLE